MYYLIFTIIGLIGTIIAVGCMLNGIVLSTEIDWKAVAVSWYIVVIALWIRGFTKPIEKKPLSQTELLRQIREKKLKDRKKKRNNLVPFNREKKN